MSEIVKVASVPAVPVFVPSYNYGRFIAEADESVLGQTLAVRSMF